MSEGSGKKEKAGGYLPISLIREYDDLLREARGVNAAARSLIAAIEGVLSPQKQGVSSETREPAGGKERVTRFYRHKDRQAGAANEPAGENGSATKAARERTGLMPVEFPLSRIPRPITSGALSARQKACILLLSLPSENSTPFLLGIPGNEAADLMDEMSRLPATSLDTRGEALGEFIALFSSSLSGEAPEGGDSNDKIAFLCSQDRDELFDLIYEYANMRYGNSRPEI